jgi:hypothetical protein
VQQYQNNKSSPGYRKKSTISYYNLRHVVLRSKITPSLRFQKKGERGICRQHVGPTYPGMLLTTSPTQQLGPIFQPTRKQHLQLRVHIWNHI